MRKPIAAVTAAILAVTLGSTAVASAAPSTAGAVPAAPQQERAVPVKGVPVVASKPDAAAAAAIRSVPSVDWSAAVTAKGTPARVQVRSGADGGVNGVLLRVRRTDGVTANGPATLTVDYGRFRHAFGGNWGDRLRLVRTLDNAIVPSRNDRKAGILTAQVDVNSGDSEFAVTAAPSGSTGNYTATPLALSSSWDVSGQTGDFSWNYPLRVPETPGSLSPQLAITYSSGSVDGRTASTNNQPSWVGEGFDLWSGYIERAYKPCSDDLVTGQPKTGDQCWAFDNATVAMSGHSGPLVRDSASGVWRLKKDDGTRIEKLTGASNGDNDGEHWRLTTREGIQYYFGSRPETQSTWTVPVFGNHAGEPCHAADFASSWCRQAHRWNLDYVVDPRGNTITYKYVKEANSYGLNLGKQTVAYDRGGVLERAEFGTRRDGTGAAPASVVFTTAERCLANCAAHTPASYPDVPWDQNCTANCTTQVSPTFWTTKRLSSITTYAGTTPVERWTLDHLFPDPGDTTSASLWLSKISHSGLVGGTVALPPLTFSGEAKPNRINSATDGLPPMNKYRIIAVNNEYGGAIGVNYAPPDCSAGAYPVPDSNTKRCFPQYWQPDGGQPLTDWMHKYVVESMVQVDRVGGSPTETTSYEYLDGGAWHYTDNEMIKPERRTWSEWRGYQRVMIRKGQSGTRSAVEHRYFRGMHGDRLANGGTRSVSIPDSQGGSALDLDQFNGQTRETITYNGSGGPVLGSTVNDLWSNGPTATQGPLKAYMVDIAAVRERTAVRRTHINRGYNADGLVSAIDNLGNVDINGDEECTRTWYTNKLPTRVETVGVACTATPSYPADTISDTITDFDAAGNQTRVQQVTRYNGGTPVYQTMSHSTYDAFGRPLDVYDALDRKTMTRYTETGGLNTGMTSTNALGHITTTDISPHWGEPLTVTDPNGRRTDVRYDAMGRVTGVWLPGRSQPSGEGPNMRYQYQIRNDGPSAIITESLRANGNYLPNYALYDGFLRTRQTQTPGWGGGRVVTDTVYDDQGRVVKTNGNYYVEGAPTTSLVAAGDNNIPNQTVTQYDGAGRATASIVKSLNVEKWRTTMGYGGDRLHTTPPAGGTATTAILDAEGKTIELHQYQGTQPTGPADVTKYTYAKAGQIASVTDPTGNQWRYTYDLLGHRVAVHDPDTVDSTATYDAAGQLLSATDGRGVTLTYKYDALGRKTEERDSALRATWTYDTLLKGLPTSSTRIENGNAYITGVVGYDAASRPTGTKVTVPVSEGALTGTYQMDLTYRPDGSVASTSYPKAGTLPAETVTYSYDDFGFAKTSTGLSTYVNDTAYTRFGELAQMSMGGTGKRVWNTLYYDAATRRLARSLVEREATTNAAVNDYRYKYDPAGNVISVADVPASGPSDIQCFGFDYLRRTTDAWTSATEACTPGSVGGSNPYSVSYRYDVTGNRTGETQQGLSRTYQYTGHRLGQVTTTTATGSSVDSYQYDAIGNTKARTLAGSTQTLSWDPSGRLVSAQAPDGKVTSIGYDADGNRLVRRDPEATTLYLGAQQIRLHRGTGVITGTRFYTHGGKHIATRTGSGLSWQASDHHETATTNIAADTLAVTRRLFTPFGDLRGAAATWPDERAFVGGTRDDSLGLVQLGAREYDPKLGRFISVDPIIDHHDPQQLNGYAYANSNPSSMSDADGLRHIVDVDGMVSIPSLKYATPQQIKRAQYKAAQITKRNNAIKAAQKKRQNDAIKASGHSRKQYDEAKKIKQKSTLDVVIEAGGEILAEFLGINDIKGCFGNGDLGSCISMVMNVVPWSKLFKIGELIGAVRRAWKAVSNFAEKRKWADDVLQSVASCETHSFRPDTRVRMADGSRKPIGQVKLGDKVLATDPKTGRTLVREVVALHVNTDRDLADVRVRQADGTVHTLHTTQNHPFWSDSAKAWMNAGELKPGDRLATPQGAHVEVVSVTNFAGEQVMRDLTIDELHTYYVVAGDQPVLVHNNSCPIHPNGLDGPTSYTLPLKGKECKCPRNEGTGHTARDETGEEYDASRQATEQRAEAAANAPTGAPQHADVGADPTIPLAVGAGATAMGIKLGWRKLRDWWQS